MRASAVSVIVSEGQYFAALGGEEEIRREWNLDVEMKTERQSPPIYVKQCFLTHRPTTPETQSGPAAPACGRFSIRSFYGR